MQTKTYTTATGAVLIYQRLPLDTTHMIKAAVMREFVDTRPTPPLNEVETLDGVELIANEHDPVFIEGVKAWETTVEAEVNKRLARLITDYGLEPTPIDGAAVERYRAAMQAVGVVIDESDADVYFWRLACPDQSDIQALMREIVGLAPLEEAIRRARQAFSSAVSRPVDLGVGTPVEQEPLQRPIALS